MAVGGIYMSDRVHNSAVRRMGAYGEWVPRDLMPIFTSLEARANAVGTSRVFVRRRSQTYGATGKLES
jgi:hypothetical protein